MQFEYEWENEFHQELLSIFQQKPPVSLEKISQIVKSAQQHKSV